MSMHALRMGTADYVTTGEAARLLGVGLNTVKRWITNGDLKGIQTPGGHWRIPKAALEHLVNDVVSPRSESEHVRVLIVDDDPHLCELLEALLDQLDFPVQVQVAHDGYSGLIQIGSWHPDVLILDVCMPELDGIEVLRHLQGNQALAGDLRVIVITAALDQPEIKAALDDINPDMVLGKPINVMSFAIRVADVLGKVRNHP